MKIEERKMSIIQKILVISKEKSLDRIDDLLNSLSEGLSSEQKKSIEEGLSSYEKGEVYTHEEVMDFVKEKFPRYFK